MIHLVPLHSLVQLLLLSRCLSGHDLQEVSSNASTGSNVPNTLLMTCQVQVMAPDGTSIKARALLDSGSTMSFVSECTGPESLVATIDYFLDRKYMYVKQISFKFRVHTRSLLLTLT